MGIDIQKKVVHLYCQFSGGEHPTRILQPKIIPKPPPFGFKT